MKNWVEVSEARLTANFLAIERVARGNTKVLGVIKANAYGHGAELCAQILVRAGAVWLGVTCAAEGTRVRQALRAEGLTAEILIMSGFLPGDAASIHLHALTPVLWTREQVAWLSHLPGTRVHIEVDTGMGRQGVPPAEVSALLDAIGNAGLVVDGIFTHFCSSEVEDAPITGRQRRCFTTVLGQVRAAGVQPAWIHTANTSAIDNPGSPKEWLSGLAADLGARMLARTGIALYGYCLPLQRNDAPCGSSIRPAPRLRPAVQPVMTWKALILAVRLLQPGDTVGYNATYTAERTMRIALLPAGYADGLRRELSSTSATPGGWTLIRGERAPILGRISMNLTVVDVSGIEGVEAGDEAILLGDGVTADDHAAMAHTIAYEILCGIHPCS